MEEYEATKFFNDLLIENDLPIIPLKINGKLKNVLGQIIISKSKKIAERIEISKIYLKNGTDEEIIDTIKHEIAHYIHYIICGYTNHDMDWQKIAEKLGIKSKRTKKIENDFFKYHIVCSKCGKMMVKKHRITRIFINKVENKRLISSCCYEKLKIIERDI
jgi:predicted SprT family Zn-dependent metalloprotease